MAKTELSKLEWLNKAEAYCARAEHCAADVRRKLYEWGLDDAWTAAFIEKNLYENDFLNDERFAQAYVHDKVEYQRWGRVKIQAGLQALQLPDSVIQEALLTIDESTYLANLRHLISSQSSSSRDPHAEPKLLRFLAQRGFRYEEIQRCLRA